MAIIMKPGWLYFLRDRDFRTGKVSKYVKIGKTDYDRPVASRLSEHQTGNPREVYSVHEMQVSSIDTVETHLHHLLASHGVHGEWFELDDSQVQQSIDEAKKLEKTLKEIISAAEAVEVLKTTYSNGKTRDATPDEKNLLNELIEAKKEHIVAAAITKFHNEKIRRLMGNNEGIKDVAEYQVKTTAATIDSKKVKELHPSLVAKYTSLIAKFGSDFKAEFTNPQLRALDGSLNDAIAKEKDKQVGSNDPTNYSGGEAGRTPDIENAHLDYVASLGEASRLEIKIEMLIIKIKAAIGEFDIVAGLGKWIRQDKETEKIDWPKFKEENPKIVSANMKPEIHRMAMKVKPFRPY
jgi:hypothetical protein